MSFLHGFHPSLPTPSFNRQSLIKLYLIQFYFLIFSIRLNTPNTHFKYLQFPHTVNEIKVVKFIISTKLLSNNGSSFTKVNDMKN